MKAGRSVVGVVIIAAMAAAGCGNSPIGPKICDRPATDEPIPIHEGQRIGNVFQTSGWGSIEDEDELLYFDGGRYYEIHHNLGAVPVAVHGYVSFERYGLAEGSVSETAGNQMEVKALDENTVTVLNGSCTEYYLRVVVIGPGDDGSGGSGSGGAGGAFNVGGAGGS